MIVLDTSILIDSLSGAQKSARAFRDAIHAGQRIVIPTLVLYECCRGLDCLARLPHRKLCFLPTYRCRSDLQKP